MYPDCIRCGMCCIVTPCYFSKVNNDGVCIYLSVNKDDTTTCFNRNARIEYSGSGCVFMTPAGKELYNEHMEFYSINERKQEIKATGGISHGGIH